MRKKSGENEAPARQVPSICRMVIYTDHGGRQHPAVITSIYYQPTPESELVNLCIFNDGGGTRWASQIPHGPIGLRNSWSWPERT